jgi:hypothetical protein
VSAGDVQRVGLLQVAVFLDELVLLAVLAIAGARLVDGTAASIALAVALPLVAAVGWGLRLAPKARRRLGHPARLTAKLVLIAVASALLVWAELPWWGVVFFLVSSALLTWGELSDRDSA